MTKFSEFLKIPSISTEKKGIQESVDWLKDEFKKRKAETVESWDDFGDFPVVMAKFSGNTDKTVLIYNHYDVQPIGDFDSWETDPFQPVIKNHRLFCRGASDCKGEIIARLMVVDYFQKNGGLPCNLIFLVEGEEEIGSPNLKHYIEKYQKRIKADVCLWECGWKNEKEQLEISCGVKGILSFDLEVETASQAIHSSYAGIVQNAGWRMVQCLTSFKNEQNRITIRGFHDDIVPLKEYERKAIAELNFDAGKFKQNFSLKGDLIGEDYQAILVNEPTFNISQIQVGNKSSNNSVPAKATAKIDCRFVPKQDPKTLIKLIEQHLKYYMFDDIAIKNVHWEDAYRSDLSNPYVEQLIASVEKIYGEEKYQLIPNFAGGGPMALFGRTLTVPIVAIGCSYSGSNVHSPNENIRLTDLEENVHCLIDWMKHFTFSK